MNRILKTQGREAGEQQKHSSVTEGYSIVERHHVLSCFHWIYSHFSSVFGCVCVLQVEVIEGCLQCPESGREFPISRGIPNMLLNEDEV